MRVLTIATASLIAWAASATLIGCDDKTSSDSATGDKKEKTQTTKCDSFEACDKECNADNVAACVEVGDYHRKEPRKNGKWDETGARKAYKRACDAEHLLGCAKLSELRLGKKRAKLGKKACDQEVELGCVMCAYEGDKGCATKLAGACNGKRLMGCTFNTTKVVNDLKRVKKWEENCQKGEYGACQSLGSARGYSALRAKALDELVGKDHARQALPERKIKMFAKACDEGLAAGWEQAQMSCSHEANAHISWLRAQIPFFLELPIDKRDAKIADKRDELKKTAEAQEHVKRLRKVLEHGCAMGDKHLCEDKLHASFKQWL